MEMVQPALTKDYLGTVMITRTGSRSWHLLIQSLSLHYASLGLVLARVSTTGSQDVNNKICYIKTH